MNIEIDPLEKYAGVISQRDIISMCGFIPEWVAYEDNQDLSFMEVFKKEYQFGFLGDLNATITKDGVWKYEGDPDLYPLIKIEKENETMYQYNYGLVSVVNKDGTTHTIRMD